MDTLENETPVGVEGATSSQDTVSDETQPVESADSVSDGQAEETEEAPTLLAGKYKSPEELEKAYTELQHKLGEVGQKSELVNLLEKQTGMNAQQIKDYLAQQQYQQYQQTVGENPGLAAYQEVQQLKNQLALQQEEQKLDKFLSSPDGQPYQEFKDKILKLGLNLERDKDYADIAREYFGQARAKGQQDAYKKIENKEKTRTTGVSQAAPKAKVTLEDLERLPLSEQIAAMESMFPHADTSNRPY